jgi:hypothetical protein
MKNLWFLLLASGLFFSCSDDNDLSIMYPNDFLPAYPGSWWSYSNGDRSTVYPEYVSHNYEPSINSPESTSDMLVPYLDGEYLYEYKITQMSTEYPVKKLLDTTVVTEWAVNFVNGETIYRKTTAVLDSFYLAKDSTLFKDVVTVVEFQESMGVTKWNTKEYYARDIGLIRIDVNNPLDTLSAIIQKEIVDYNINN